MDTVKFDIALSRHHPKCGSTNSDSSISKNKFAKSSETVSNGKPDQADDVAQGLKAEPPSTIKVENISQPDQSRGIALVQIEKDDEQLADRFKSLADIDSI